MAHASHDQEIYFVPQPSHWPIVGTIGLFLMAGGSSIGLNGISMGYYASLLGFAILVVMMFGWFGKVIAENLAGSYNAQVDRTFRWGMSWFIFSEVMFFAAFFGALFYARHMAIQWLAGAGSKSIMTHLLLWPHFEAAWPTNGPAALGGQFGTVNAWELPAINTAILLTSSWTVTMAHHAVRAGHQARTSLWLALTIILGASFLVLQVDEYRHAYEHLNLTLGSGIYGSTFYMLTGFHGAHVTLGTIMLTVMLFRSLKGHFRPERHFAFEATSWYWHFVDVVWLGLFIFVYIL
jgi:cytochrome c oxidase subunit 3